MAIAIGNVVQFHAFNLEGPFEASISIPSVVSISDIFGSTANASFIADFVGVVDEIRSWDVIRTASQLRDTQKNTLNGNENGLIAYWKLDECAGRSGKSTVTNGAQADLLIGGIDTCAARRVVSSLGNWRFSRSLRSSVASRTRQGTKL